MQLQLVSMSEIKTEKERVDNKVSRQYYTATFINPENPFSKTVSRVFWQQHNVEGTEATWKTANPELVKRFIGKLIPGRIVSSVVEEYDIVNPGTGEVRTASTYTAVVLEGETAQAVFKAAGKTIVEAAPSASMIAADSQVF
jgi:hypothetical protein